jgi:membrane associated rhomboid family serine protease
MAVMWWQILIVVLEALGIAYLLVVSSIAFKQRSMIVGIVLLNIFIFLYTFFFNQPLIEEYALSGAKVAAGQGSRLITYAFMHANFAHIFFNSLGLLFFGYNLEKEIGGPPTIIVYFTSVLVGGAVYSMTAPATSLVVGASAGVFGLMAFLTLIRPFKISPLPFIIPLPVALGAVLYALISIPLLASGSGIAGGIAHNAHIGGLIGGALMAFGMNRLEAVKGLAVVVALALIVLLAPAFIP